MNIKFPYNDNQLNRRYLSICSWGGTSLNKIFFDFFKKLLKLTNFNLHRPQELCVLSYRNSQCWGSCHTEIKVFSAEKSELPKILSLKPTTTSSFFLLYDFPIHSTSYFQTLTMKQGTLSNFVSGVKNMWKGYCIHTSCIHSGVQTYAVVLLVYVALDQLTAAAVNICIHKWAQARVRVSTY